MLLREIRELVDSTEDAAFAAHGDGKVIAFNRAAERLLGTSSPEVLDRPCWDLLRGTDCSGGRCRPDCPVVRATAERRGVPNFDLRLMTAQGPRWCNLSTLRGSISGAEISYRIHILRQIDLRKRLELLLADFVASNTGVQPAEALAMVSANRSPARVAGLSCRETEVLRCLARGATVTAIAATLGLSPSTVNNHIQHCLDKLGAHSRLEAIRSAEAAGLI